MDVFSRRGVIVTPLGPVPLTEKFRIWPSLSPIPSDNLADMVALPKSMFAIFSPSVSVIDKTFPVSVAPFLTSMGASLEGALVCSLPSMIMLLPDPFMPEILLIQNYL